MSSICNTAAVAAMSALVTPTLLAGTPPHQAGYQHAPPLSLYFEALPWPHHACHPQHQSLTVGGALLFGGTAYFSYRYSNAHAVLPTPDPDAPIDPAAGFRVFDAIADKYDEAIGQEEAALW